MENAARWVKLSDEQKALFNKETVSDIFPFHYIIRVNQFDGIAKNTIDEWIYFFKNSEIKEEFKAKGIQEAREKLKTISNTPEQLAEYQSYLKILSSNANNTQTINCEKKIALKQQKVETAKDLAKKMIHKGATNEKIADYTELTIELIENIRNGLKLND